MLPADKPRRNRAARCPFRQPAWGDDHPDFRRLDDDLPAQHPARAVTALVARLDLEPLRLSYAGYGSRAYPVERLLAFVLWMYSQGILSPAQWAEHARYDDRARWLLRGLVPSRARLYAFRDRLEPFLDAWHAQSIRWAILEGITTAARGSLDGSFVAALASRHRLVSPQRLDRRLLLLRLLVWLETGPGSGDLAARLDALPEGLLGGVLLWLVLVTEALPVPQGLPETLVDLSALLELLCPARLPQDANTAGPVALPAWVPATPAGRRRVLARYEVAQQRLADKQRPYLEKRKRSKKDQEVLQRLKISPTDPAAALGWDKAGTYRPLYNVPLVQATDAALTLAWDVLPRNNDDGLLRPMMEKTQKQLGRHLDEVVVDRAFVSVADVSWCEGEKITVYASPVASPERAGSGKQLPKSAFRYDAAEEVYSCPEGKRLEKASRSTEQRSGGVSLEVIVHRASGSDCSNCGRQRECTKNPRKGRVVKRYVGEEALERLEERMAEASGQAVYRLRCQSVELGYADLKEHRGLRVFRCFGLKRSRVQAGLVILASNGLKIVRALQQRGNASPPTAPPQEQAA